MVRIIPGRLYKYQPFSAQTLTSLKGRTLWFGRPSRLNDPFDCAIPWQLKPVTADDCVRLLADRSDPQWSALKLDPRYVDGDGQPTRSFIELVERVGRQSFQGFADQAYNARGVTCFSESPDDPLLWAHYAAGHRGICLEFDTSSEWLRRFHAVQYRDDLLTIDVVDVLLGDADQVLSLLLTKSRCWAYEREWRAIHKEPDKEYCYGVEGLTGLYLGAALTKIEKDLVCHTVHGTPVQLYEVRRSPSSFRLEVESVTYTPYQHP